jgi:hypothetical protein
MFIDFKKLTSWTGASALAACCMACTATYPLQGKPDSNELRAFLERREVCDHLRGEIPDPGDRNATRDAVAAINQYCTGTDAQLSRLKRLFAVDAAVMKQLNALEPCIENSAQCRADGAPR